MCDEFAEMAKNKAKRQQVFHLPEVFFSSPSEFRSALYGRYGIEPCDEDPVNVLREVVDSYFDKADLQFSLE